MEVIDFFCGAGGFSEGFRQQGFKIVMGVDNWKPAVDTHNLNHNLEDKVMDILDFEKSIKNINDLPDTEIIIGSPPCVSFSMSNNAGKADKSLGIRLIESYLRVIAVKKHQRNSKLKAWLMENVPNSRNFVKETYTFKDLNLTEWAQENKLDPEVVALKVKNSGEILTASDYGSPQKRQRFVCGEVVETGKFPLPNSTHIKSPVLLGDIIKNMPKPNSKETAEKIMDPNYPNLIIKASELSDHFYDTGVYEIEWRDSKFNKVNHPFMGKMSFPENFDKPSRTIMATRSASTREALLYMSETNRKGDGEYRLPTIREASSLMGFPYTYQFLGSEGTKWRLIGNAVCPHMSFALAKQILINLGLQPIKHSSISFDEQMKDYLKTNNLNDGFKEKTFSKPPKKKNGARFRKHTIKAGNITVNLANYHPNKNKTGKDWYGLVFIGSGKTYQIEEISLEKIFLAEKIIKENGCSGFFRKFIIFLRERQQSAEELQSSLESNNPTDKKNPSVYMEELAEIILEEKNANIIVPSQGLIQKDIIPMAQVMSIYGVGKLIERTTQKNCENYTDKVFASTT